MCNRRHSFPQNFWKRPSNDASEKLARGTQCPWSVMAFASPWAEAAMHWALCADEGLNPVGFLPWGTALGAPRSTRPVLQMLTTYGKKKIWESTWNHDRSQGTEETPFFLPCWISIVFPWVFLWFSLSPLVHFCCVIWLFRCSLSKCQFGTGIKEGGKSLNQRPGFINKTSTYFISLFNSIFLLYGCSVEEAEQQHVELLLILHIAIT